MGNIGDIPIFTGGLHYHCLAFNSCGALRRNEGERRRRWAIRVDDMEAPVFKALLCFVYTDSLPETTKEEEDVMYHHLLVAADRYDLGRLKLICEDKLCKRI